ncbi:MAG: PQQ-binding-like beta-propeller repeat protein [bacterium]|nr:PQQ-binding-like beta-propeller repeat protein [bacterium]
MNIVLWIIFIDIIFGFKFGTVNLGDEAGKKAIEEWHRLNPPPERPVAKDDPRLHWISEKMDGSIYWPSIAILGDTIYVGTSGWDDNPPGIDYTNGIYALDRNTGKIKLKYLLNDDELVKGAIVIGKSSSIYFMVVEMTGYDKGHGKTYLLSLTKDLTLRWKKEISILQPHFWGQASPAIDKDENIYIHVCISTSTPPDYVIISYDKDGLERWRFGFKGMSGVIWPAPVIDGTTVYANTCNGLYALTTSTGGLIWHRQWASGEIASPAVSSEKDIYVVYNDGGIYYFNAYTHTGSLKWRANLRAFTVAQPVIGEDGTIYQGTTAKYKDSMAYPNKISGFFWAIDPSTGGIKWMFDIDEYMYDEYEKRYKISDIYAPAVVGKDGTIYFTTEYRYIFALNPDGSLKELYDLNKMAAGWPGGSVTYSALVIDENGILYKADSNRDSASGGREVGRIIAIKTQSMGLASSPWPKGYNNYLNTNSTE